MKMRHKKPKLVRRPVDYVGTLEQSMDDTTKRTFPYDSLQVCRS